MTQMSHRNTLVRSLHDLGLAAWFGGSLAGAVAVNGAAADIPDPTLRLQVVNTGWARWTPVNAAAIAAHLIGGAGLLRTEPAPVTPPDLARAQQQLDTCQWLIPTLTGGISVLNALHGEQQRPAQQVSGIVAKARQLLRAA
jgi:hypothetical protein